MGGGSGRLWRMGADAGAEGGGSGTGGGGAPEALFWYSSVRLELGELVVPVRDQAIGGTFGDAG